MKIQKQVELEYGEPFWDVVKSYADEGESITATAALLGYGGHSPFVRLVKKHNKAHWFRKPNETNGAISQRKNPPDTPARRAALALAYSANPVYKWVEWRGVRDTIAGHARRAGITRHTAYGRLRKGMSMDKVFNPVSYRRTPPPRKPSSIHPWNKESL